jgi:glycosyltransferase involved in cell wall biosynthesis
LAGRLDHREHARDPSLRALIDVVPFGIEAGPPQVYGPALRGVLPGLDERSRILLWAGGIWDWLDPITVIRAVHELSRTRKDVRLVFLGLQRPNSRVAETTVAEQAVALARELGLAGTTVVFNEDWVPYERRGTWLAESDIGVSAHFDNLEARFAFRTRLLDYLWAGLPVATTRGDELGELVAQESLGAALPAEDVAAWVAALGTLLDDEGNRRRASERVAAVRRRFEWGRVVEPLARLVAEPGRRIELPRQTRLAGMHESYLRSRIALLKRGAGALPAAAWQRSFGNRARLP